MKIMKGKILLEAVLSLLFMCFLLNACAPLHSAIESRFFRERGEQAETPRELAREGMIYFQDKNYKKAIETFQKIKDLHPFSPYTILAELKIADSRYYRKHYEEALAEYEDFEKLHPRNEVIPYVIYQMGMCHFSRMLSVDRDKTTTNEALHVFEKLIRTYPKSEYAVRARERIKECHENLAAHEFYVGKFYFKTKHYEAALGRFETLLTKYPHSDLKDGTLKYIGKCQAKLDKAEPEEPYAPESTTIQPQETLVETQDESAKVQVQEIIEESYENLAAHEFYVGKFYFKTKHYEAALKRFQKILEEYPDTDLGEEVAEYIDRCKMGLESGNGF